MKSRYSEGWSNPFEALADAIARNPLTDAERERIERNRRRRELYALRKAVNGWKKRGSPHTRSWKPR